MGSAEGGTCCGVVAAGCGGSCWTAVAPFGLPAGCISGISWVPVGVCPAGCTGGWGSDGVLTSPPCALPVARWSDRFAPHRNGGAASGR